MQTQAGKFRTKKISFTTMSNHVLLNPELDMATKALHALINYFLSIPNFTLYKAHVQHHTHLGDKAFNRMWKLLKDTGYLIQHKLKDDKGIFYYEYELLDQPLSPDAPLDSREVTQSVPDEPVLINNTLKKNTLSNKTINKQQQQENKQEKRAEEKETAVVAAAPHLQLDHEVYTTYTKAFNQKPNAMIQESLIGYLHRFEKDVVLLAIEMAGSKGKGIDYVYGILKVWAYEGAYTFDDVVAYEESYGL